MMTMTTNDDLLAAIDGLERAIKGLDIKTSPLITNDTIEQLEMLKERLLELQGPGAGIKDKTASEQSMNMLGSTVGGGHVEVGGDVFSGDKIVISGIELDDKDTEEALYRYLLSLQETSNALEFHRIDPSTIDPSRKPIKLTDIFVCPTVNEKVAYGENQLGQGFRIPLHSLNTTAIEIVGAWEIVPMTAIEAVDFYKHVIVDAPAGRGKSAFVNYLMCILAGNIIGFRSNDEHAAIASCPGLANVLERRPVPLKIDLGDFSTSVEFGNSARHIWNYVKLSLSLLSDASRTIYKAIRSGQAFLAFDGLDLISDAKQQEVLDAIFDLKRIYPNNHYLLTTRPVVKKGVKMDGFNTVTLSVLSPPQVETFVSNWYSAARRNDWKIGVDMEAAMLRAVQKPHFAKLAQNPLLLTQMILLHSSYGRIRSSEEDLYEEMIKLLMDRWQRGTSLLEFLEVPSLTFTDVEAAMLEIGFETFNSAGLEPIRKIQIMEVIQRYLGGDWGKAQRFCNYIEDRTGLLIEQSGRFRFLHSRFQEYLAAKYLASQHDFYSRAADLVNSNPDKWRDVYVMAVKLSGVDRGVMALSAICYENPDIELATSEEHLHVVRLRAILIAAEAMHNLGITLVLQRPERRTVYTRLKNWLVLLLNHSELNIEERVHAGNLLAQLGDPREYITLTPELIFIPKGSFLMNLPRTLDSEQKGYEFEIPYDYWIGKYPITQSQYALFLAENPDYPVPEGSTGYAWDLKGRTPPGHRRNHPVVLISWSDAHAYCNWLNKHLVEKGAIAEGYRVRLPTEAEWDKAMRGGLSLLDGSPNPVPARAYPWGDVLEPDTANLPGIETTFEGTTPIGVFARNISPYGVVEMAGNAMEWTTTSWGSEDPDTPGFTLTYDPLDGREQSGARGFKVLKGGSWLFGEAAAQCSCRLFPEARFADVGMRIVVAPDKPIEQLFKQY